MGFYLILSILFLILFGILVYLVFLIHKQLQPMANYPMPAYHFLVEWGGTRIGFTEVSGLNIFFEPVQYREGDSKEDSFRRIPGLTKYSNITLRRGIVKGDNQFFEWLHTKKGNTIERRDITIQLLDEEHKPVVIWKVKNAFPVKYAGPVLNAKGSDVAMEELELTHEGIEIENKG